MNFYQNLKKGDRVVLNERVYTINRTTKMLIILNGTEFRFRRSDGYKFGDSQYYDRGLRILELTDELIAEIREINRTRGALIAIKNIIWDDVNVNKIERILSIVGDK